MKVIGICGEARCGKDTFAEKLYQKGYVRLSMADPIKDAAKLLFGFDNDQLYGSEKDQIDERYGTMPRKILQQLGTDFCRSFHDDIFVNRLVERAHAHDLVVVPDIRFPNEASAIKDQLNGVLIRIRRPETTILAEASKQHISETLFDQIHADFVIENNGSLQVYEDRIDKWIVTHLQ